MAEPKILGTDSRIPPTRTLGPLGMNGDAADPNTLDWWFDETPGSLGANDQHDPSTPAFQMQQVIKEIPQAQTLSDWHQGRVKKFEFEPLERMSTAKFAGMSDA